MGYGHHRAAYPLRFLSENQEVIEINSFVNQDSLEGKGWKFIRTAYESISRLKKIPLIGSFLFSGLDFLLKIPSVYQQKNFSKPDLNTKILSYLIRKGLLKDLFKKIKDNNGVVVTTFYLPMLACEYYNIKCYLIICDTDINRVWIPYNHLAKNITFCIPCDQVYQRMKKSKIAKEQVYRTGFPLDKSILGDENLRILKIDLAKRLAKLDTRGIFRLYRKASVKDFLGEEAYQVFKEYYQKKQKEPINIAYAIGGAGAQKEALKEIITSLNPDLRKRKYKLFLIAGIRPEVIAYCQKLKRIFPDIRNSIRIISGNDFTEYYENFVEVIKVTDILWTKPSELSFYTALGIPVIINPVIGSQENYNKKWLLEIGAAFKKENYLFTHEWLHFLLKKGRLAEAAWNGFLKARKLGVFKIEELILHDEFENHRNPLKR